MYVSNISPRAPSSSQKLLAKAIYDNIAESPDELAFKKGDILNVIEQDTDGLEGWWLCSLRGRQGICPGNRLRIFNSYDSGCFSSSPSSSPSPSLGASTSTLNYSSDCYENSVSYGRQGKRRSWHITPHKVITPQKCGDVYLYDLPFLNRSSPINSISSSIMSSSEPSEAYDTPKPSNALLSYDCPKATISSGSVASSTWNNKIQYSKELQLPSRQDDSYDIPRPVNLMHQQNMTPSSSNSSLLTSDSLSLSSSNRSSLANLPDYDIPRRNTQAVGRQLTHQQHNIQQNVAISQQHAQLQTTYDFPQANPHPSNLQCQTDKTSLIVTNKELPLELSSALETLAKLQNEATFAVTRLLAFVTPNWRTKEKLEPVLMDIKLAAVRLRTALHDLSEFGEGALGNATRADDKNLAMKLKPLIKALRDANKLVCKSSQDIEMQGWTMENLSRPDQKTGGCHPPDSLDQLIACAQTLTEDVRQSTSFIQGNATLLFKRTPITPTSVNCDQKQWLEDYDYVSFESKDAAAKKNSDLREAIPQSMKNKYDSVIKNAEAAAISSEDMEITNANDKSLLKYYASQILTHMTYLTQAIDSFLETVEKNQPPKFFIAYGKFVVLSAHNLVGIGDIIHRNVSRQDVKGRVQQFTDALSDALKTCVAKSKKAAQHFPSVNAVQEMVDSVVDISHLASDLKIAVLQAVQT